MKKFIFSVLVFYFTSVYAEAIQIISDAETENTIKEMIAPLVKAANLNPNNIKIIIVVDPSVNAFVANGSNVFINTGTLINFSNDPNMLYGIMAHEIGHVYAAHLIARRSEMDNLSKVAAGGTILGLASILAGAPDAGAFIASASTAGATQTMFGYSRMHETEADKIAINLLYKTHNNGEGLLKVLKYFRNTERTADINPYYITHPLSSERIASVENAIKDKLSKFGDNVSVKYRHEFIRIAYKLEAFLANPSQVIRKYRGNDYALSIGYFRQGKLSEAANLLDKVIDKEPKNPYLWELKGQFYFENGKFINAEKYYQKALSYLPGDVNFKLELASVQVNMARGKQDKELLNNAISLLRQVTAQKNDIMAYFMLSRAYGKLDEKGKAILALAEFYFYQREFDRSETLANKVLKMVAPSSKEYLRASDIIEFLKNQKKRR